ncbi:MAG: hypothetical protein HY518_05060, partial [Candidatus Aenigmarchaeota archaeon]|nr:hypothetical protein [Candidatus Aenigmarchaeota archaeon]
FLPVLIATAVAFALFFYVIYPDGIRKAAIEGHYKTTDIISILNPSFELPDVVASFFFTNSYLFLFALLITLYGYRKRIMKAGFFKDNLKAPRYYTIFIVMFALSFLIYSFTAFGDTNKYLIYHNYVPLMILMGKPLSDFARNRKALLVLVIITAVSFAAIAPTFPYFGHYANFNVQKFYAYEIYGGSHITATQDAIDYLGSIGNPDIVTNEQNLIFKYQGKTSYILPPYDSSCNAEYAQSLTRKYIVYFAGYTVANSYQEDPYVCPYLRAYNLANVAEFKDDYQTFLNRFPVVVYKIEEAIPLEIQQG